MPITVDLPEKVWKTFEQEAITLYGKDGTAQAMVAAVESWLEQHRRQAIERERQLNNRAYQRMKDHLEQEYPGKYVVIAHGRIQAVADTLDDLRDVASDTRHRIVLQIGRRIPTRLELGWTTETQPYAGPAQTTL